MISLKNVAKSYTTPAGEYQALRGIDLELNSGEFVAIVGKSGSGKSTLLNLLAGIDRASSGSINIDGTALVNLSENQLAVWRGRTVGFVFQFFQLLPTLTAAENVMLPMDFVGSIAVSDRRPRALELLERVGVRDQADKLPSALSGGQQQRVAIARALANNPRLILADEPTGNLDSETSRTILELFHSLKRSGTTVVIATHERDIAHLLDRTVDLADGRISQMTTSSVYPEVRQ
jgi:putative ABC transport system ATP-binding protein